MYNIQQESLFSLEDLLEMSPKDTYGYLFETLDINPFLRVVSNKAFLGAPTQLNYAAMLHSLFIRIVERIPTIKDLRKRLKRSIEFSTDCGFTGSDRIPSESSYTRLIQKLQSSTVFQQSREEIVQLAFQEGFIDVSAVAIDATHVEARDRQPEKNKDDNDALSTELPKKKRGRKCPFNDGQCQKVFKKKVEDNPRRYTVPARGSDSYYELYKKRTAVERVNAYLKEYFQLNNIRHRGALAKVDFEIACLTYNACKLTVDRLNQGIIAKKSAA